MDDPGSKNIIRERGKKYSEMNRIMSKAMRWKSLNKHCLPARKLMAPVFWDRKGMPTV
jgi:hypothetical protein